MLADGENEIGKCVQFYFEWIYILLIVLIKISNTLEFSRKSVCAFLIVKH